MAALTLHALLQGIARVVAAATEYTEVEDFTSLEAGPAPVLEEGFVVEWLGDRNTGGLADHPDHNLQAAHSIRIRIGKQYFPGVDGDGVSLRRNVMRELGTNVRPAIRSALLAQQTEDLADALVTYEGSAPVAGGPGGWAMLDLRFRFVIEELVDAVAS